MFNQKGFSLLELIVAMGIASVLMAIAAPNYQNFQARARQKEGFHLLNSFYTTAQSTRMEFGVYPGDLVQTGFQPTGELGYRLHSENGTQIELRPGYNDDWCMTTGWNCDCEGACPEFKTWTEAPMGAVGSQIGPTVNCSVGSCSGSRYTTDSEFRVNISGVININAATMDCYAIDHNKNMEMCYDGLN